MAIVRYLQKQTNYSQVIVDADPTILWLDLPTGSQAIWQFPLWQWIKKSSSPTDWEQIDAWNFQQGLLISDIILATNDIVLTQENTSVFAIKAWETSKQILKEIHMPLLTNIDTDFSFWQMLALTDIDMPSLVTVGGTLFIQDCNVLTNLDLTALTTATLQIAISGNFLTWFSLPALTSCPNFNVGYNWPSFSVPNIVTSQYISLSWSSPSINFNSLQTLDSLQLAMAGSTSISLPALNTVNIGMSVYNCTDLVTLSMPNLNNVPNLWIFSNSLLTTVTLWTLSNTISFSWSDCAFNVATVNSILVKLDANGLSNGTVTLIGGTNATPTGAGATAAANLISKWWTVATN